MLNIKDAKDIIEFKLKNETIEKLEKIFDDAITNDSLLTKFSNCTSNGIQTKNIVQLIDDASFYEICGCINEYIRKYHTYSWRGVDYNNDNCALLSYDFMINYMHMIQYENGSQKLHHHAGLEDYSFIVYLNNSDAGTKFYYKDSFLVVKSERGKLVAFDATVWHEAEKCTGTRKVLVGAVKLRNKIWN